MRALSTLLSVAAAAIVAATPAFAGDAVAPNDVKIVDGELAKSLTGKPGDPVQGASWFKNRKLGNCLACHANSDMKDEQFHGEVGPTLDGVGSRYEAPTLRAMLVNSKAVFGDQTVMPGFYRVKGLNRAGSDFEGKPILTAQQVEDVLAYLLTLKDAQ